MKPYDLLPDGTIQIHPDQQADLERLFARAGVDPQSVKTEEDYDKALALAGGALFGLLFGAAEAGDQISQKALHQFTDGDLSNFKATIRRATFKPV